MFKTAQIKLTFFYSALFLLLFWLFSLGIYTWMDHSFGEGYISQVKQKQQQSQNSTDFDDSKAAIVTVAGDVALSQLRNILFVLNGGLFIVLPIASWFLAKRTLAPVAKIHEQQKQFVSDASHEMRTPLSIISGEIEVTLNKKRTAGDYKKTLQSTKEETDRLSRLVENLLFLAREDQGKLKIHTDQVDIVDLVSGVLASFKSKIAEKQLKVDFNLPQENITVLGEDSLLYQLFANLIENAIRYTPKGGQIKISFIKKGDKITIQIKDTGIGIAESSLIKIFDRFYRVDDSRSVTKGYGLGLAISKAIVDRYSGRLLVSSTENKGSTFTVEFSIT